ncbi:MAG: hypothetical protein IT374_12090 [Polyangiaceae bacterium]|nr:hypothetical protein [Polyangiaceae bacterium]
MALLDKLKVWFAVKLAWSDEARLAEAVRGFQATEADGVWHLHRGLARVRDPRHRAILFAHSLEEEAHAEEFAYTYNQIGERAMTPATYERSDLYGAAEPTWKLFAYVHVGERDATDRFRLIQQTLDESLLKRALSRIVSDEEGHVDLTHRMLIEMGATDRQIRGEVRRVRLARLWEAWLRVGKRVVDRLSTVLLSVSYFLIGPFLFLFARRRLAARFVEFDNCKLKRL